MSDDLYLFLCFLKGNQSKMYKLLRKVILNVALSEELLCC